MEPPPGRIQIRRRLRLSIALPVAQVAITAVLTFWANRVDWIVFGESNRVPGRFARLDLVVIYARLLWRGVNAPTFPLCMMRGHPTRWTLGFGAGELLNLSAVAFLWYSVGRFFDRRRDLDVPNERQTKGRKRVISILLLAWGMFLLGVSLLGVRDSLRLFPGASPLATLSFLLHFRPYVLWDEALFLLWSLILIVFHGTALARTMHSGRTGSVAANW